MSLVVNTNVGSLNAQRSLAASGAELKTAMERLSSGKKINSAADDAAGFAIAERMTAQIRGLNMATKNANDGLSMLAVIENATNDVTDMLQRVRELAVQAVNDTNSNPDRQNLQEEARALIAEIDRVASATQYNGTNILDGSYTDKKLQLGYNAGDTINFSVGSLKAEQLGIGANSGSGYNPTDFEQISGNNVNAIPILLRPGNYEIAFTNDDSGSNFTIETGTLDDIQSSLDLALGAGVMKVHKASDLKSTNDIDYYPVQGPDDMHMGYGPQISIGGNGGIVIESTEPGREFKVLSLSHPQNSYASSGGEVELIRPEWMSSWGSSNYNDGEYSFDDLRIRTGSYQITSDSGTQAMLNVEGLGTIADIQTALDQTFGAGAAAVFGGVGIHIQGPESLGRFEIKDPAFADGKGFVERISYGKFDSNSETLAPGSYQIVSETGERHDFHVGGTGAVSDVQTALDQAFGEGEASAFLIPGRNQEDNYSIYQMRGIHIQAPESVGKFSIYSHENLPSDSDLVPSEPHYRLYLSKTFSSSNTNYLNVGEHKFRSQDGTQEVSFSLTSTSVSALESALDDAFGAGTTSVNVTYDHSSMSSVQIFGIESILGEGFTLHTGQVDTSAYQPDFDAGYLATLSYFNNSAPTVAAWSTGTKYVTLMESGQTTEVHVTDNSMSGIQSAFDEAFGAGVFYALPSHGGSGGSNLTLHSEQEFSIRYGADHDPQRERDHVRINRSGNYGFSGPGALTLEDSFTGKTYELNVGGTGSDHDIQLALDNLWGDGTTELYSIDGPDSAGQGLYFVAPQGINITQVLEGGSYRGGAIDGGFYREAHSSHYRRSGAYEGGGQTATQGIEDWAHPLKADDDGRGAGYNAFYDGEGNQGYDPSDVSISRGMGHHPAAISTDFTPDGEDVISNTLSASLLDVDLVNNASEALNIVSAAIDQVAGQKAELGATQNRLEYTVSNLMNVAEFTTSARSRIEDADFAAESARLAKAQVLQQTGTAMLAQANAQPQLVLSLIK